MLPAIVNGYLCTTSCDVASAKQGIDPHPSNSALGDPARAREDGPAGARDDAAAVIFGGSLAHLPAREAVPPVAEAAGAEPSGLQSRAARIDLRV
jgi:hypothetical protein